MNQTCEWGVQKPQFTLSVPDNAASYTVHSSEDINDQLFRSVTRMTRLLAVLPGGVIVLSCDGMIQQSNAAAVRLLSEPLDGEPWTTIIERAFRPHANNGHDMLLHDGRLVHISTKPLEGESSQIVLLNDVTETRKLQRQVAHLQRLSSMGEMAARLAHQIRTPLSTALLYVAPLLKENTDPKLIQRFAKRLHNSISHMERLVKDMLAFSRGDMAETAPVLLQDLLSGVEQQFRSQSDTENIHLEIHDAIKGSYVYGSKDALTSALNNLVNNARLACTAGGYVSIFVDIMQEGDNTDYIEISVEDDGVGIAQADQDKILTPFFTTRSSGTGLGLAVVKSIAKAHKGELWFESDEGEGSTFCLRLPLYQPANKFMLTAQK
ncbi:MAG: two-component system sensor histidine kinase FlrB [Methylophagaceae bacterium]|jgi:two-component system sensor histidine kinase FlrB